MMNSPVAVMVDSDSLAISRSGAITGRIWIEVDDAAFPEAGWSDFPVVLLTWWLEQLSTLVDGSSSSAELRFMDGPFAFRVEWRSETESYGSLLRDGQGMPTAALVMPANLLGATRRAAAEVIRVCDERGWATDDTMCLRMTLTGQ